jgi:diguanylate cyclase
LRPGSQPDVSLADVFFVAYYPLLYVALVGLVRSRVRRFHPNMWLDGVIGALGAAAVTTAVLLGSALHMSEGSPLTVMVYLAYPLADLLLLVLLVGVGAAVGLRSDRTLMLVGAGLLCELTGDILFLRLFDNGSYVEGGWRDLTGCSASPHSLSPPTTSGATHTRRTCGLPVPHQHAETQIPAGTG